MLRRVVVLWSLSFVTSVSAVIHHCDGVGAVSYELNGGRLGDNIRSFTQAYWESYKHDLPLLYVPFPGSEALMMHEQFEQLTAETRARYGSICVIGERCPVIITDTKNTLYITTYFCKTDIDWTDRIFVEQVKQLFLPREPQMLPEGIENGIGLHIRRGGGFHVDTPRVIWSEPAHFPELDYFARALDYLLTQLEGRYKVFMFTDDPNPAALAHLLCNQLKPETAARVELRYRDQGNFHDRNVIEDFVALQHTRYIIRPISNFSEYAFLLGNHECSVVPTRFRPGTPYGIVESAVFIYKDRPADFVLL